jgi:hypothetical protein
MMNFQNLRAEPLDESARSIRMITNYSIPRNQSRIDRLPKGSLEMYGRLCSRQLLAVGTLQAIILNVTEARESALA